MSLGLGSPFFSGKRARDAFFEFLKRKKKKIKKGEREKKIRCRSFGEELGKVDDIPSPFFFPPQASFETSLDSFLK